MSLTKLTNSLLATVMAGLLLMGCSSSRAALDTGDAPALGFPNHTLNQIRTNLGRLPIPVNAYEAESSLSLRSPLQSGSFSATIQHRRNDSLLISISPGLGITAVRALVTPDSFFVYDRIHKELSVGSIDYIQQMLPLPLSSETLYASMLGLLAPNADLEWTLDTNRDYYIITDRANRYQFTVDPVLWRVVRYEERDIKGNLIEERTFSDFQEYDGVYLPRRLTFRRPADSTAASLFYRKMTVNPTQLTFNFDVNSSVQRISYQ